MAAYTVSGVAVLGHVFWITQYVLSWLHVFGDKEK